MLIKDIIKAIDDHAPPGIQEEYDNSGLITGDPFWEARAALFCLDVTEPIVDEAIDQEANLIVSHHPLIFKGLKRLNPSDPIAKILIKAIKHGIAIFSAHTNLDKVIPGVSSQLADKLALKNQRILVPDSGSLLKLVAFIPADHVEAVSAKVYEAGAGHIGNYDSCSFQTSGQGTFRGSAQSDPFVGGKGELHHESEIRFESIVPNYRLGAVLKALLQVHPYEEVAYDIIPLQNENPYQGLGIVGNLDQELSEQDFLSFVKESLGLEVIRHTRLLGSKVSKVAVCGGSGSDFTPDAIRSGAQVYISGDFKYHQFFDANRQLILMDIGHYESERYAIELLKQIVTKKFPTFAVHLTDLNTNPINYF